MIKIYLEFLTFIIENIIEELQTFSKEDYEQGRLRRITRIYFMFEKIKEALDTYCVALLSWTRNDYHGSYWAQANHQISTIEKVMFMLRDELLSLTVFEAEKTLERTTNFLGTFPVSPHNIFDHWQWLFRKNHENSYCDWITLRSRVKSREPSEKIIYFLGISLFLTDIIRTSDLKKPLKTSIHRRRVEDYLEKKQNADSSTYFNDIAFTFLPERPLDQYKIEHEASHIGFKYTHYAMKLEVPKENEKALSMINSIESEVEGFSLPLENLKNAIIQFDGDPNGWKIFTL